LEGIPIFFKISQNLCSVGKYDLKNLIANFGAFTLLEHKPKIFLIDIIFKRTFGHVSYIIELLYSNDWPK